MSSDRVAGPDAPGPEVERSIEEVEQLVGFEVRGACSSWGPDYASAHEAFGVLLEEVEEFKAEVWQKRAHRNKRRMLDELVQVAAVAIKYAAQIKRSLPAGGGA